MNDEHAALVEEYLRHLEWNRLPADLPRTRAEADAMLKEMDARQKSDPHWYSWETLDEMIDDEPEVAWRVMLDILSRCHERDLGSIGAGPLETLVWRYHETFVDRCEHAILHDERLREAFTNVRMGGVPLVTQRRLNAALVQTGIDPASLVEFDEVIPDEP